MQIPILMLSMLLFICSPLPVQAQLFIEEGKVVLSVAGGERVNKTVTVANTSNQQISAKIYWEDFQYEPPYDGSKKFFPTGIAPNSAGQWVTYSPQEITLPPFGKQKIDYTVTVPASFEKGTYGVLLFELTGTGLNSQTKTGIDVVTRVGALFFIEPKGTPRTASLSKLSVQGEKITGSFVNSSVFTLVPRIVYYFMDAEGLVKERGQVENLYVPSGQTASWELSLPSSLNPGHYTLVINADLEEQSVITKEIGLTKDSFGQLTLEAIGD